MIEERIREYIIEGILGRGGMGSVYLATHIHLKKKAALKVLLEQFSEDASIKTRFVNEASLLHDLHHKNIVQQKEFFEENGRLVLVMEYVDGRPLDKMIGQDVGPIPWEKALPLFTQILDGIGYAHSKGIVHRDIKPANILISKEGQVKVTDLGIAKIAGEKGMTRTGAQMGTLYYESPEQIRGAKDVDHRSDIYSLGMTLYEMLAGRLPFDKGGDTSEFELMIAVVQRKENLDPREFYPHIPEWLVKTIQKATELNPEKRFQSCEHFKQIIEKYGKLSATESTFWSGKVASVKSAPLTTPKPISTGSSQPASVNSSEDQCPKCNVRVKEDMEFCMKCGISLQKICPNCSSSIRWYADFCPKCGANEKDTLMKQEAELLGKLTEEKRRREQAAITLRKQQNYADRSRKIEEKKPKQIEVEQNKISERMLKDANGIVTDSRTHLEWRVAIDSDTDWYDAESWVKSLGGSWRMPFCTELRELYKAGITSKNWGFFHNGGYFVWSGQTQGSSSAGDFDFFGGYENCNDCSKSFGRRAFAVRSD